MSRKLEADVEADCSVRPGNRLPLANSCISPESLRAIENREFEYLCV